MRITLATEGTYPYHKGGVSQWCDVLIRGLPDAGFHVLALTGNMIGNPVYSLPPNVLKLTTLPPWRIDDPLEIKGEFALTGVLARKLATKRSQIEGGFIPHLQTLLSHILMPFGDRSELAQALCSLYIYFQRYDYTSTWKSAEVWETAKQQMLILAAASNLPAPSIHECVEALIHMVRLMSVLTLEISDTNIYHATVAAYSAIPGVVAKSQKDGIPFLLTEHGVFLRERSLALVQQSRQEEEPSRSLSPFVARFLYGLDRAISQMVYQSADLITPVCDYNRRWEIKNNADPAKVRTISNGIDYEKFFPALARNEHPTIAWVGRIDPLKDVKTLIRAMAVVHQAEPKAVLRMAGIVPDGAERYFQECWALFGELGLAEVIQYLGPVTDVVSVYHKADIVVLSSISEGFPYTIIEAMMCGRPVVATAVGGVPFAIGDTGLLVDPGNPEQLGQACLSLLQSEELRLELGQRAGKRARDLFTEDKCLGDYRQAYAQLWQTNGKVGSVVSGALATAS